VTLGAVCRKSLRHAGAVVAGILIPGRDRPAVDEAVVVGIGAGNREDAQIQEVRLGVLDVAARVAVEVPIRSGAAAQIEHARRRERGSEKGVEALSRKRVSTVERHEQTDVIACRLIRGESRAQVDLGGVEDRGAAVDEPSGLHHDRLHGHVVGVAVERVAGRILETRLCEGARGKKQNDDSRPPQPPAHQGTGHLIALSSPRLASHATARKALSRDIYDISMRSEPR
jgi:hypothetical protein